MTTVERRQIAREIRAAVGRARSLMADPDFAHLDESLRQAVESIVKEMEAAMAESNAILGRWQA